CCLLHNFFIKASTSKISSLDKHLFIISKYYNYFLYPISFKYCSCFSFVSIPSGIQYFGLNFSFGISTISIPSPIMVALKVFSSILVTTQFTFLPSYICTHSSFSFILYLFI